MKLYILILFLHPNLLSTYSDSTALSDESGHALRNKRSDSLYDNEINYIVPCNKGCGRRRSATSFSSYNLSPQNSHDRSRMNSASGRYTVRRKEIKNRASSWNGVRRTVIGKTRTNSSARTFKTFQNITKWKMNRARKFLASLEADLMKRTNKNVRINEVIKLLEGAQGQFRAYSDTSSRSLLKSGADNAIDFKQDR